MDEFSLLAKHLSFVISLGNMGESVSPAIRGEIVAGKNQLCMLNMVAEKLRNPFQVPPNPGFNPPCQSDSSSCAC